MSKEDNIYLNAFESIHSNVNKTTKRRSSILKSVDINYGELNTNNDKRRSSRRVSWAQTYQLKELLADGTTVIMSQELENKLEVKQNNLIESCEQSICDITICEDKSDENFDQNNIIIASDFISRLKANNTITGSTSNDEIGNKRHQNSEDLMNEKNCSKPKKAKKNNTKNLTKYLVKHYNTEDKKDCETVFNTSFNKYGRELVPRTERPDLTQLFTEDCNAMELTGTCGISTQDPNDKTDRMSLTLTGNENTTEMSVTTNTIPISKAVDSIAEQTHYFSNESIAVSKCSDDLHEPTSQSLMDETNCFESLSNKISDAMELTAVTEYTQEMSKNCGLIERSIDFLEEKSILFTNESIAVTNCSEDKKDCEIGFDTPFNKYDRELVPSAERQDLTQLFTEDSDPMELTEAFGSTQDPNDKTDRMSLTLTDTENTSKLSVTTTTIPISKAVDSIAGQTHCFSDESISATKCSDDLHESTTDSLMDETNCDGKEFTAVTVCTQEINRNCGLVERSIGSIGFLGEKSILLTNESIAEHKRTEERVETNKIYSFIFGTNCVQQCVDTIVSRKSNAMELTSVNDSSHHSLETIDDKTNPMPESIDQCMDTKEVIMETKEVLMETKEVLPFSSVFTVERQLTTTISRPNRYSLIPRLELSKALGLGITQKLKQKRDEFEAKKRQTIEKPFTPNASNSSNVSEVRKTLAFSAPKVLSDLSKANEHQNNNDMSVDTVDESLSVTQSLSQSKSENSDLKTESSSESKIQSNNESKCGSSSDSKSESSADKTLKFDSNESSICIFSKSQTSSVELNSTSPLSVSEVHSSDNYLMSSPTTIDPTLNFTFHASDTSDDFDPFIHTNQSFHATSSFYDTLSPLQLSFMVRDDTLCILADELERQIQDIVIPTEEQKLSVISIEETNDLFTPLRKINAKQNGFTYEILSEEKALISYLWGTFALEIRFGNTITDDSFISHSVRNITSINMKSLVSAEEPLYMRQKDLILKFNDSHKPLIIIAHDLIISSFETEKTQILSKYKTTASLDQLISDISVRVLSAKKLLSELRIICSSEICRIYPKQNDRYSLVIEIMGLRKPFYLIIPINPKSYPDEVIHPIIKIRDEDKHLYCVKKFSAALLMIESRKFNYIQRLIRGTKLFVKANKKIIYEKQIKLKQKNDIQNARLS